MRVAAVITTFNRLESLRRCIEHVRAQTRPGDDANLRGTGWLGFLAGDHDLEAVNLTGSGRECLHWLMVRAMAASRRAPIGPDRGRTLIEDLRVCSHHVAI